MINKPNCLQEQRSIKTLNTGESMSNPKYAAMNQLYLDIKKHAKKSLQLRMLLSNPKRTQYTPIEKKKH